MPVVETVARIRWEHLRNGIPIKQIDTPRHRKRLAQTSFLGTRPSQVFVNTRVSPS